MSCSMIGRNVELAFFDFLVELLVGYGLGRRKGLRPATCRVRSHENRLCRGFVRMIRLHTDDQIKKTLAAVLGMKAGRDHCRRQSHDDPRLG